MFDSNYMRKRKYLAWRAPIICSAIKRTFAPTSVIDFGCATGDLVRSFNELSITALGVDSSESVFEWAHPETPILTWDISTPLPTKSKFDLALCIEVIRFLSIDQFAGLVANFITHSKRVFIGYGGEKREWVIKLMEQAGYTLYQPQVQLLQEKLSEWKTKPAIKAIYHGGMYFI